MTWSMPSGKFKPGDRVRVIGPNSTGSIGTVKVHHEESQTWVLLDRNPDHGGIRGFYPHNLTLYESGLEVMLRISFTETDS